MRLERGIISSKGLDGIEIGGFWVQDSIILVIKISRLKSYYVISRPVVLWAGSERPQSLATVRIGGLATYQIWQYTMLREAQMSAGHRSKVATRDVDGGRRGGGISKVALRTEIILRPGSNECC